MTIDSADAADATMAPDPITATVTTPSGAHVTAATMPRPGAPVVLYQDGVRLADGRWSGAKIEDCPARLGAPDGSESDAAYAALDAALTRDLAVRAMERGVAQAKAELVTEDPLAEATTSPRRGPTPRTLAEVIDYERRLVAAIAATPEPTELDDAIAYVREYAGAAGADGAEGRLLAYIEAHGLPPLASDIRGQSRREVLARIARDAAEDAETPAPGLVTFERPAPPAEPEPILIQTERSTIHIDGDGIEVVEAPPGRRVLATGSLSREGFGLADYPLGELGPEIEGAIRRHVEIEIDNAVALVLLQATDHEVSRGRDPRDTDEERYLEVAELKRLAPRCLDEIDVEAALRTLASSAPARAAALRAQERVIGSAVIEEVRAYGPDWRDRPAVSLVDVGPVPPSEPEASSAPPVSRLEATARNLAAMAVDLADQLRRGAERRQRIAEIVAARPDRAELLRYCASAALVHAEGVDLPGGARQRLEDIAATRGEVGPDTSPEIYALIGEAIYGAPMAPEEIDKARCDRVALAREGGQELADRVVRLFLSGRAPDPAEALSALRRGTLWDVDTGLDGYDAIMIAVDAEAAIDSVADHAECPLDEAVARGWTATRFERVAP